MLSTGSTKVLHFSHSVTAQKQCYDPPSLDWSREWWRLPLHDEAQIFFYLNYTLIEVWDNFRHCHETIHISFKSCINYERNRDARWEVVRSFLLFWGVVLKRVGSKNPQSVNLSSLPPSDDCRTKTNMEDKVKHVVVDAGPFIKNAPIEVKFNI